jgi:hypothetical protein
LTEAAAAGFRRKIKLKPRIPDFQSLDRRDGGDVRVRALVWL